MSWWKHYDKSRWQQERERLHLMDTAPAPPDPDISIKTTIRDIFSRMNAGEQSVWRQVEQEWNNLAGTVIARHTSPVRLDHKMLVVAVDSAVWLNELIRLSGRPCWRACSSGWARTGSRPSVFKPIPGPLSESRPRSSLIDPSLPDLSAMAESPVALDLPPSRSPLRWAK